MENQNEHSAYTPQKSDTPLTDAAIKTGALHSTCLELEAKLAAAEKELAKWNRPFDAELFEFTKNQAYKSNSLAAQGVYIIALEHALKHKAMTDE